mmetsp:Transcript_20788/g.52700  ORF Transcript_20788/g.52700 Transcript_20788/m.52700 type:complete len:248 (-) Transcript_20788:35-778(-)
MLTLTSESPSAWNTCCGCPWRRTSGAPELDGRISMSTSGAAAPSHRERVWVAALDMAFTTASLAAQRPANEADGSAAARHKRLSSAVKFRFRNSCFAPRSAKVSVDSTSTPKPRPALPSRPLSPAAPSSSVTSSRVLAGIRAEAARCESVPRAPTPAASTAAAGLAPSLKAPPSAPAKLNGPARGLKRQVPCAALNCARADGLRYTASSSSAAYGGSFLTCTKGCFPAKTSCMYRKAVRSRFARRFE